MKVLAVIPARFGSTRLPGKPLLCATGRPLIQHVYEQVKRCTQVSAVLVATDDERIQKTVQDFGGQAEMTRADHPSGTDRIAEVAGRHPEADLLVNVQGDEPEIEPETIDKLIEVHRRSGAEMSTVACPFPADGPREGPGSPLDPNCVKVVLRTAEWDHSANAGWAIYFSRSLIPFPREAKGRAAIPGDFLLHLGLYAYSPAFVQRFAAWPPGKLELLERLEQLRVLENGARIAVAVAERASVGIDTPADYAAFVERWQKREPRFVTKPST